MLRHTDWWTLIGISKGCNACETSVTVYMSSWPNILDRILRIIFLFPMAQQPLVGLGVLVVGV
jgi:hypothetical protein